MLEGGASAKGRRMARAGACEGGGAPATRAYSQRVGKRKYHRGTFVGYLFLRPSPTHTPNGDLLNARRKLCKPGKEGRTRCDPRERIVLSLCSLAMPEHCSRACAIVLGCCTIMLAGLAAHGIPLSSELTPRDQADHRCVDASAG